MVLAVDLLDPVEVGEHLQQAAGFRVGVRAEALHVLVEERLEDGSPCCRTWRAPWPGCSRPAYRSRPQSLPSSPFRRSAAAAAWKQPPAEVSTRSGCVNPRGGGGLLHIRRPTPNLVVHRRHFFGRSMVTSGMAAVPSDIEDVNRAVADRGPRLRAQSPMSVPIRIAKTRVLLVALSRSPHWRWRAAQRDREVARGVRGARGHGTVWRVPPRLSFYRLVAGCAPMQARRMVYAARMVDDICGLRLGARGSVRLGQRRSPRRACRWTARAAMHRSNSPGLHAWSTGQRECVLRWKRSRRLDTDRARPAGACVSGPAGRSTWTHDETGLGGDRRLRRTVRRAGAAGSCAALTERSMLLHGDIRADNLFFDGERAQGGRFSVRRMWVRGVADIAYLVTQGLPTEVRRGHDEALVRCTSHACARSGVTDYDVRRGVAALSIRRRLPDGLLPVITLSTGWDAAAGTARARCALDADRPGGGRPSTISTHWRCSSDTLGA